MLCLPTALVPVHVKIEAKIITLPTMGSTALFKGQLLEFHTQVSVVCRAVAWCRRCCDSVLSLQNIAVPCVLSRIRHVVLRSGDTKRHIRCVVVATRSRIVHGLQPALILRADAS